ncbi:UDP-2,3-diacylglucosamine diphosphatase [Luteibaculum oceani]|uniref:UDP-2,3-diacylglucosamine diphosphatase n=1 Tax=Luteibaculum oceani TaxID=1294296 RepID=A0A5C6UY09_9FLAO|nr:UDP-2,3-diacylglucosamine diphosphatase [Luteibaculum oceani]TXC78383.1 UDP-2,3-diacylglucosamine diphosphatase [Luteibaculum oceani]
MEQRTNIYFASDFHLGVPNREQSLAREKLLVSWLDEVKQDAREIFLLGDVFDFWFDYEYVVPKGFVRLLGKIAEITDSGIPVHMFPGNHDMWNNGYFEQELGVTFHAGFYQFKASGKQFLLHHGDGIGPGDHGYKFIKKIFTNSILQKLFKWFHPDLGVGLANFWSRQSSKKTRSKDAIYHGKNEEWLVQFCEDYPKENPDQPDYFIFGHRHLALDITLSNNKSRYLNLGDWLSQNTYAKFDGEDLKLYRYPAKGKHEIATNLPSG